MTELLHKITEELQTGVFPDLKGRRTPLWLDGSNLYFEDKAIKGGLGQYLVFNPSDQSEVLGIATINISGTPTIFYGTLTKLWKWTLAGGLEEVTRTSGGAYTGTSTDLWDFAVWGDYIAATNGVDTPQLFKSGDFAAMGGLGSYTTFDSLAERSPYLLSFNNNTSDREVAWTDTDDIEDWVLTDTNAAGAQVARGLNSEIIAAKKLGEVVVLASTDELRVVEYIREPFIFGVKPRILGHGAVGKHAIIEANDKLWGFGPRTLWVSDLVTARSISQGILQDYVYNNINRNKWKKVVAFHDRVQSVVGFYYPTENSDVNDRGVGYNYETNSWTLFNYGRSAATDASVFDFSITGDTEGNLYFASAEGAPTTSGDSATMCVNETCNYTVGYGELGYGEGGYGGSTSVS